MKSKTLLLAVALLVVIAGVSAVVLVSKKDSASDSPMTSGNMPSNSSANSSNNAVVETNMITYKNFEIMQKNIRAKKGTTVTWTNQDNAKHDVTPNTETEDFKASELFGKGETYSVTFNKVGKYSYHCSPHPYMRGTVEVVE